jgi:hypothetical protein
MRSSAGSSVSDEIMANPTPTAESGPSPAVELTSASVTTSSAAMTVPADAMIAGAAPVSALRIASWVLCVRRSSSR